MPAAALKIVEAVDSAPVDPQYQAMLDTIDGLQRDIRGWARRYADLQRDKNAEARSHEAWPVALRLWGYWVEQTGHARAKWSQDRFWILLPHLQQWGAGNCAAAIAGIAFDANSKRLKNGKLEVFDTWELCFRSTGTVERYMRRRPSGWALPAGFEP